MHIKEIVLKDFRNYQHLTMLFSENISYIIGPNGAGKTNIIEAITVLSNLRSFRNINDSELIRWGSTTYFCSCLVNGNFETKFEVAYNRDPDSQRKRFKIDNAIIKNSTEYYGNLLSVVLSPSDIQLVYGNPDIRRKYFDSIISKYDKNYFISLIDFKKCLFNRNRLLKQYRDRVNGKELDVWDQIFAEKAAYIISLRRSFINVYNDIFQQVYKIISGEDASPILKYMPSMDIETKDTIDAELKRLRPRDTIIGSSTKGPQRDDYLLENDKSIHFKNYASQGQKRTAAITMKIAERDIIERIINKKCVLLIDDIFSELDRERQINLIELLKYNNQLILTMVDSNSVMNQSFNAGKVYHIDKNGAISER